METCWDYRKSKISILDYDIVIKINTNYCPQCRKYFIGHDEYVRYRQIYGVLLGNIKITNGSFVQSETDLADESILHMCGYSVNQADNLTSVERQGILQYLIDSKVSSKPEIIEYLNFFIKRNGKRQNMEEAVRRWNEDLRWVREYQLNRQRYFEISNIQKNKWFRNEVFCMALIMYLTKAPKYQNIVTDEQETVYFNATW